MSAVVMITTSLAFVLLGSWLAPAGDRGAPLPIADRSPLGELPVLLASGLRGSWKAWRDFDSAIALQSVVRQESPDCHVSLAFYGAACAICWLLIGVFCLSSRLTIVSVAVIVLAMVCGPPWHAMVIPVLVSCVMPDAKSGVRLIAATLLAQAVLFGMGSGMLIQLAQLRGFPLPPMP